MAMFTRLFVVASSCFAVFAAPAFAEQLVLKPRYAVGDSYRLALRNTISTETSLSSGAEKAFHENVQVEYTTKVVVLEVDAAGQPLRERHHNAQLTFMRPNESGSLLERATFQVRREDGETRLFVKGKRLDARYEKLITDILDHQFQYTLGPALFDPGRAVEVGESWELDPKLTRKFLAERGLHVVALDGAATARLERRGEAASSELVIHYSIPIEQIEVPELPENARVADSQARFAGEIHLGPEAGGAPLAFSSNLDLSMQGVVPAPRVAFATPVPWSFQRSQISDQQTQRIESTFVSGL
jgi:hypothetical protein